MLDFVANCGVEKLTEADWESGMSNPKERSAELTGDPGQKAALYCRAIRNQRQEKFRTGYRFELARLLQNRDNPKAAHPFNRFRETLDCIGLLDEWYEFS